MSPNSDHVESFVWNEGNNNNGRRAKKWRIQYTKSSRIYDSDPHSLKIPNSHVAWKKELLLTRFANQELPEALWGENFLSLTYGVVDEIGDGHNDCCQPKDSKTSAGGVRISFCALEALRTWALMDMNLERNNVSNENELIADKDVNDGNTTADISDTSDRPTIIQHKSGRTPDPWDYTYTTNYAGSVRHCSGQDAIITSSNVTTLARQPDRTTIYAIRVEPQSMIDAKQTEQIASGSWTQTTRMIGPALPSVELRPPMCKCIGGRMICAGVAQNLKGQTPLPSVSMIPPFTKNQTKLPEPKPPRPSPTWMPYSQEKDGAFDIDDLLQSQRTPPAHYTGTIPLWIQNLDPQSYSFLTVTALACDGVANNNGGGFMVVLLRCFVRVNGVKVRLIDTKFLIRRKGSSDYGSSMMILRERSWKEGTWEEYTIGMSEDGIGDLGSDLEQGKRASKNLKHKIVPIIDKMVLCDGDDDNDEAHDQDVNVSGKVHAEVGTVWKDAWRKTLPLNGKITRVCSNGSSPRITPLVINGRTIVALDTKSGDVLWEHDTTAQDATQPEDANTMRPSLLSLAIHGCSSPSGEDKVLVGDDRGFVHVVSSTPTMDGMPRISQQSFQFCHPQSARNIQRLSSWVEKVVWSKDGRHFAAAAGRNAMIDGKVLEMKSTVYDLAFVPSELLDQNADSQVIKGGKENFLAVAQYGGVTIIDAASANIFDRTFVTGSTAVLSFAVSSDGLSIGIGCLDKRLRIFQRTSIDTGSKPQHCDRGKWIAQDWVGFDGGVSCVGFSPGNRKIAALGGSILVVVDQDSEWGEAPILCSLWPENTSGVSSGKGRGKGNRLKKFAWKTSNVLVVATDCFLYTYDVRATIDTVPKKCYPIDSRQIEKGLDFTDVEGEVLSWVGLEMSKIAM